MTTGELIKLINKAYSEHPDFFKPRCGIFYDKNIDGKTYECCGLSAAYLLHVLDPEEIEKKTMRESDSGFFVCKRMKIFNWLTKNGLNLYWIEGFITGFDGRSASLVVMVKEYLPHFQKGLNAGKAMAKRWLPRITS